MIRTKSMAANYLTEFTDGTHVGMSDAPVLKRGDSATSPLI